MRHWLAVASSIALLLVLGSPPALARTTMHQSGGSVAHHHHAAMGNRFAVASHARFGDGFFLFDRLSRQFVAVGRHGFGRFGRGFDNVNGVDGFGGWGGLGGWWGWDGWTDGWAGGPIVASAEPPAGEFGALPPRPPRSPAELPPCHEATPVGVVIERASGCAH